MLKKTITYTDYNGNQRTENFYFYLNKAEVMDMELGVAGGLRQMLQLIIDRQDIPQIIDSFKKVIRASYGEKTPDGRRFIKSKELTDAFVQTEAYAELYMELLGDADKAAAFINGIMPAEVQQSVARESEVAQNVINENNISTEPVQNVAPINGDANLLGAMK